MTQPATLRQALETVNDYRTFRSKEKKPMRTSDAVESAARFVFFVGLAVLGVLSLYAVMT